MDQKTGSNIFHTEIVLSPDIICLESENSFFIGFVLNLQFPPLYFTIVVILTVELCYLLKKILTLICF